MNKCLIHKNLQKEELFDFFFFKATVIKHSVWGGTNSVLYQFVWIITFKVEIIEKYFEIRLSTAVKFPLFKIAKFITF